MPPARLPARIDRRGLGGGSFFPPDGGADSPLATGAVAAATEAIVYSSYSSSDPVYVKKVGWQIVCPVAVETCAAHSDSFEHRSWDRYCCRRTGSEAARARTAEVRRSIGSVYRHGGVEGAHACVRCGQKKRQDGLKFPCVIPPKTKKLELYLGR